MQRHRKLTKQVKKELKLAKLTYQDKVVNLLTNELNTFYNRFNICDFSAEVSVHSNVFIDKSLVFKLLRGVYLEERKSLGPDDIGGRVLRNCDMQLAGIFCFIFQWSLKLHKVPSLWKDSVIVPMPKIQNPKTADDFRPVALTSLVMKNF